MNPAGQAASSAPSAGISRPLAPALVLARARARVPAWVLGGRVGARRPGTPSGRSDGGRGGLPPGRCGVRIRSCRCAATGRRGTCPGRPRARCTIPAVLPCSTGTCGQQPPRSATRGCGRRAADLQISSPLRSGAACPGRAPGCGRAEHDCQVPAAGHARGSLFCGHAAGHVTWI